MSDKVFAVLFALLCVLFTTAGQLMMKKGVSGLEALPASWADRVLFLAQTLFDPWIFVGIACAFAAMLAWLAALSNAPISYIYPFMSISFLLVTIGGMVVFREHVPMMRWGGLSLIILGVFLVSRS